MTEARDNLYDKNSSQQNRSSESAWMLQLYRKQDPPGEIVLDYNIPVNETFLPISEGRFLNISKLAFRSGWLRAVCAIGAISSFPLIEILTLNLVKTPHHLHEYPYHQVSASQTLTSALTQTQGALEPTVIHAPHHHSAFLSNPDVGISFLTGIFIGLMIIVPVVIVTKLILTLIYSMMMMANLYLAHGSKCVSLLRSPTNIALSKVSIKLMWSGKLFSQNGAMLAWSNVLSLDFAPDEELLSTPKILIKYKMPEGDLIFPFSLAGFDNAEEAILFMELADRYVPEEVKTSAFKHAYVERERLAHLAQKDVHEEIIASYGSKNIEQQTVTEKQGCASVGEQTAEQKEPSAVQNAQLGEKDTERNNAKSERDEAKALIETLSAVENEYAGSTVNLAQKDTVCAERTN